jgi:putative hydrolase of the HAD superfamily
MYKSIFFDLDRTLWDLERNSSETLYDLFYYFRLSEHGITDVYRFITVYNENNRKLWEEYHEGKIEKEQLQWKRFYDTLSCFGIKNKELSKKFGDEFIKVVPLKVGLMPFALEAIDYLAQKYELYIITNGFEETQRLKLHHSGLDGYVSALITSEKAGFLKPDIRIFEYALRQADIGAAEGIMIGDEYATDIFGARNAGMDTIFYCPNNDFGDAVATHKINNLQMLTQLL